MGNSSSPNSPELQVKLLLIIAVGVSSMDGGQAWCQSLRPLCFIDGAVTLD